MTPTAKVLTGIGVVATGLVGVGVASHMTSSAAKTKPSPPKLPPPKSLTVDSGQSYTVTIPRNRGLLLITAPAGAQSTLPLPPAAVPAYIRVNGSASLQLSLGPNQVHIAWPGGGYANVTVITQ